jgi:hypothetical protein
LCDFNALLTGAGKVRDCEERGALAAALGFATELGVVAAPGAGLVAVPAGAAGAAFGAALGAGAGVDAVSSLAPLRVSMSIPAISTTPRSPKSAGLGSEVVIESSPPLRCRDKRADPSLPLPLVS